MPTPPSLARHAATRYVQPLREGGSLPAVVDTDGGGLFVVKFRGAGQGPKALVAELVVGLLAATLGLPVPELALVDLSPAFGRSEPDPEIQDMLRGSHGVNVGLRYLDGAETIAAILAQVPDELLMPAPREGSGPPEFPSAAAARERYCDYLTTRLRAPRDFVAEAARAQAEARREPARPLSARR